MGDPTVKMEASSANPGVYDTWGDTARRRPPLLDKPRPGDRSSGDRSSGDTVSGAEDPFRLGFRHRLRATGDGRETVEQVPLSAEDLLYPQEGDVVSDGFPHSWGLQPKADSIRRHHMQNRPDTLVTSDVVLVLRGDGKNCSPDIAVIEGDIDLSEIERAINLRAVGGRLVFALEVVSTSEKEIEKKDTEGNLKRYAKEEVEEYFSIYPIRERRVKDLVGRTLVRGDYVDVPPDAEGRVYSAQLDLFFQIDAESEELVAIDAKTGQRLLTSDEEEAGRKKAEAQRDAAAAQRDAAEAQRDAAGAHGLRRGVEDLCIVLGLAWSGEHNAQVECMNSSQLEALRQHLIDERSWPD